ncbi:MAG TPA: DUF6152 family protein [Bryobacteraceae bacterium]|jgi:hypothetical protein
MKNTPLVLLAAGVGLLAATAPLLAHHSFAAEYDSEKRITITGKVLSVELVNPHSWIHVEAAGPDGKTQDWACEFGPPNGLYRNGWNKTSVKVGDMITVAGSLAKNGSPTINANNIKTAEGKRLFAGSSEGNAAGAGKQ